MPNFQRRVSFDCYDPDLIPPQKSDQRVQIVPNTPYKPNHRSKSPFPPVIKSSHNDKSNPSNINQSLHPTTRRAYHQMSDQELLQMDSQFQLPKIPDLDSFRNTPNERLQNAAIPSGDQTSLTTFKSVKRKSYKLTDYPTKPIISRNSISLIFTHPDFNNDSTIPTGKTYLALLSPKATSICALDYYQKSLAKPGDTIVIAFSLSSFLIGDKASPELRTFLKDFTNYVLGYLPIDKPIKIIFEIFKTGSFLNDLLSLYCPSIVIIGTNRKFSRSTSFSFSQRKFIPLVYAGLEEINRNGNSCSTESTNDSCTVKFKDSFNNDMCAKNNKTTTTNGDDDNQNFDPKSVTGIQIKIEETPNVNFANEIVQLFSNLNLAPDPKPSSKKMTRRGSMHSVASSISGGMSGSAIESEDDVEYDDDDGDNDDDGTTPYSQTISNKTSGNVLTTTGGALKKTSSYGSGEQVRKWKSGGSSGSSIGLMSKEDRDRMALFEQHQKAISNVNTKKSKSISSQGDTTSKPKIKIDSANSTNSGSSSSTGGFFKKLLGKK